MHALLALFVVWVAPLVDCQGRPEGRLVFDVEVFENRCEFDAFGRAVEVADASGTLHPKCATSRSRAVPAPPLELEEPRVNELYGWPGMLEGLPPVVGARDLAGNETWTDGGCP